MKNFFRSFKRYLSLSFTLIVLVPLLVLAVAQQVNVSQILDSIAKERQGVAVLIGENLSRSVQRAQATVQVLADYIVENTGNETALKTFVESLYRQHPELLNIHIDSWDGICLLFVTSESASEHQPGLNHADRWHMQMQNQAPGSYISGAFQGKGATQRWIVSLTTAALSADAKPLGYACAALNLTSIATDSLSHVQKNFTVTIVDQHNKVIWSNEGLSSGQQLSVSQESSRTRYADSVTGWQVIVGNRAEDFARNDSITIAIIVMILTLATTGFVGAALAKPLVTSVEKLGREIETNQPSSGSYFLPRELQQLRQSWQRAIADRAAAQQQLESVNRDLERKVQQRTAQIQEQKSLLDALIRSLSDGVILYDDSGRVVVANEQARALVGIEVNQNLFERLTSTVSKFDLARNDVLAPQEFRVRTGSGKTLEIATFRVSHCVNHAQGHGLILRDVTQKAALEDLRASLVSVVAHEMKTPLAVLKLQTSVLMQDGAAKKSPENYQSAFADIAQSTESLERLISDWLDWSRIENKTLYVAPRLVRLDTLVKKAYKAVKIRFPDLEVSIAPQGMTVAYADPIRLQQVFDNLFSNAARYVRDGVLPQVHVRFESSSDCVRILVSDNGIGIDPSNSERIFDCFWQVDMGTTRRSGGTGLGLAICRGIMNALHGSIVVVYPPENPIGTVFEIILPLAGAQEEDDDSKACCFDR